MARQRDLERCGWRFFRLTASEFSRDPEASLELLSTGHSPKRDSPPLARTLASIRQKNTSAPIT